MSVTARILAIVLVVFSLLPMFFVFNITLGENYYPTPFNWTFQSGNNFTFSQAVNFTEIPHQGVSNDKSLVGYWNMNEGSGPILQDLGAKVNNGTINGATWVPGKYGTALSFDGTKPDYVKANNSMSLQITGDLTLSCWVYFNTLATKQTLIYKNWNGEYELSMYGANGKLEFDHSGLSIFSPSFSVQSRVWLNIIVVRNVAAMTITFYVNGIQAGTSQTFTKLPTASSNSLYIGQENGYNPFNGTIDDVRIYNRAFNSNEVAALNTIGQDPDPVSFSYYYNFGDDDSNNTMLIYIDAPDLSNENFTTVTCTNFFSGKNLAFKANNTSTANVWTNLGRPVFTTGVWNNQNYTTTLTFDSSSISMMDWNPGRPPYASNLSTTSYYAGNTTIFSTYWDDNHSLSGGGYIFSTNNTGRWVNTTWTPFILNPNWGNATLILNSTIGVKVSFEEYANNSLNQWNDSEIYSLTTAANYTSIPATPTPTPISTETPTSRPTSKPTSTLIPTLTSTPTPTITPIATSTPTNSFQTETIKIVASITFVLLIVAFALFFKKGYLRVEIINEENVEEL